MADPIGYRVDPPRTRAELRQLERAIERLYALLGVPRPVPRHPSLPEVRP